MSMNFSCEKTFKKIIAIYKKLYHSFHLFNLFQTTTITVSCTNKIFDQYEIMLIYSKILHILKIFENKIQKQQQLTSVIILCC